MSLPGADELYACPSVTDVLLVSLPGADELYACPSVTGVLHASLILIPLHAHSLASMLPSFDGSTR